MVRDVLCRAMLAQTLSYYATCMQTLLRLLKIRIGIC